MKILEIKISRLVELFSGIKIFESDDSLIILNNTNDYILDGITFIAGKYIKGVYEIENGIKEIVFREKFKSYKKEIEFYRDLNDVKSFLIKVKDDCLVELTLESSDYVLIGHIVNINEKSFKINLLSTKGVFFKEETIYYNKLRAVTVKNDYLSSLELFIAESSS